MMTGFVRVALLALVSSQTLCAALEDFRAYIREHKRGYAPGSKEYEEREAIFKRTVNQVASQNAKPARTWTAAVNALSDRTDAELAMIRGYTPQPAASTRAGGLRGSFLSRRSSVSREANVSNRPKDFTWHGILRSLDAVQDQSDCGSCWAIAAGTALRSYSELYQEPKTFSVQQLVSCTANPHHCGGTGMCKGATVTLALEYAAEVGVLDDDVWQYSATEEACPPELVMTPEGEKRINRGRVMHINGVRKLRENSFDDLMVSILQGPVPISIYADYRWSMYSHGVLDSCDKEAIINHGVVLVGYGEERTTDAAGRQHANKYWHIQNSWGGAWGERGFLRLQRRDDAQEANYCGWDTKPQDGNACDGGPEKVWVCGSCGILYDNSVPVFDAGAASLWSQNDGDLEKIKGATALYDAVTVASLLGI